MRSMILLELANGLLLLRNLGGKGILEGGDSADGSSIPLGGEEGLISIYVIERSAARRKGS